MKQRPNAHFRWAAKHTENIKKRKLKYTNTFPNVPLTWHFHHMPVNTHAMPNKLKQARPGMRNGTPPRWRGERTEHSCWHLFNTYNENPLLASCKEEPAQRCSGGILVDSSTQRGLQVLEGSPGICSDCWWISAGGFSCTSPPTLAQCFILVLLNSVTHNLSPPVVWIPCVCVWDAKFPPCFLTIIWTKVHAVYIFAWFTFAKCTSNCALLDSYVLVTMGTREQLSRVLRHCCLVFFFSF